MARRTGNNNGKVAEKPASDLILQLAAMANFPQEKAAVTTRKSAPAHARAEKPRGIPDAPKDMMEARMKSLALLRAPDAGVGVPDGGRGRPKPTLGFIGVRTVAQLQVLKHDRHDLSRCHAQTDAESW